jgi:hypothetical protein
MNWNLTMSELIINYEWIRKIWKWAKNKLKLFRNELIINLKWTKN